MPVTDSAPAARSHPDQDAPAERNTVLLLVIGALLAISAVVAGLVIFSSGEAPAEKPESSAVVRAAGPSLLVGPDDAPAKVVVYEDFGSQESRSFAIASRDFLRIEAARGAVQVAYRPFVEGSGGYSAEAFQAWAAVLDAGTPKQALAFHDVLLDRRPASGSPTPSELVAWAAEVGAEGDGVQSAMATPDQDTVAAAARAASAAGATRVPTVVVDGKAMPVTTPIELADELQRALLRVGR